MEFPLQYLHHLIHHYGGVGLFALLALGIFGLPIPDETLLVFTGLLLAQKTVPITIIFWAYAGSVVGVTASYLLGLYLGKNILSHFGKYIGITHQKLEKAHAWYERVGKWSLLIGYYIPGIRHIFGFFAGSAYLSYWQFALYAYTGGLIWTATFISIGYFFYHQWQHWNLSAYFFA